MLKKLYFPLIFIVFVCLWACQREVSGDIGSLIPVPVVTGWDNQPVPSNNHPARLLLNTLRPDSQKFSLPIGAGGRCTGSSGIEVVVPADAFVKLDNSPVTGQVDLIMRSANDFTSMIGYGLSTITSADLLSTGGMVEVRAKQGSDVLKIKPGKKLEVVFTGPYNPQFAGFAGRATSQPENPIVWDLNSNWQSDSAMIQGQLRTAIDIDSLGWVNCDYFYNIPGPKTPVYLKLPEAYGNTNTICFMVFRQDRVLAGMVPDVANRRYWPGASYQLPEGKALSFVAIGKKDNKVFYGRADVTITTNLQTTIPAMEEISEAELKNRLNSL
jgi:hypothetical protein